MKDFYEQLGLNYTEVLDRLGSDAILKSFVVEFLDDGNFEQLRDGLEQKNWEKAFYAVHTLKGICLNLGFSNLYTPSSELTEKLRVGETDECEVLFARVQAEYEKLVQAIKKITAED